MPSGCLLWGWRDCKMQIIQLQTVGSQGLEEFPVVLWAYQAIFWTMREMWETQWLPYRASLFSPEPPSVQCCHAGEFTKAGHLRLGDDHSTSTHRSSFLHRDLIRVVNKVLPLQSTVRLKTKFPCWEFTRRLTVYSPTFSWILEGGNHDSHLQTDIPMKCMCLIQWLEPVFASMSVAYPWEWSLPGIFFLVHLREK